MENKIRIDGSEYLITRYDMSDGYSCTIQMAMDVALEVYQAIKDLRPCSISFLIDDVEVATGNFVYRNQHLESDSSGSRGFLSLFTVSFNTIS